jgi:hypothetical protein
MIIMMESDATSEVADMTLPESWRNTTCFVRALWAHMRLRALGISDDQVRKITIEGFISHDSYGMAWDYHIATAVKLVDGEWVVFDREFGELLSLNDWFSKYRDFELAEPGDLYFPYHFLLSVRPAYQWTLISDKYAIDNVDPVITEFVKFVFDVDRVVKKTFEEYGSN